MSRADSCLLQLRRTPSSPDGIVRREVIEFNAMASAMQHQTATAHVAAPGEFGGKGRREPKMSWECLIVDNFAE